ncbi:hypothetical protein [Candidatus Vampirococcus lugosii]|uniref:DUF5610 domain-containing protein n=2 Tax=Candidatus Vampirococcus lugosii TaxID=2789015 RepID=A0ABS5QKD1_9BACT|nr:hypothetical protein [Candidatus Vampirococcus lugosii]MBS8121705.1 hypothetical protein [Candidatus Vampirococcus lugosii]
MGFGGLREEIRSSFGLDEQEEIKNNEEKENGQEKNEEIDYFDLPEEVREELANDFFENVKDKIQASQDDIKKFAEEEAGLFGLGEQKIINEMNQEIMDFVVQTISGEGFDSYQLKNSLSIDDYLNNLDQGIQELIETGSKSDFEISDNLKNEIRNYLGGDSIDISINEALNSGNVEGLDELQFSKSNIEESSNLIFENIKDKIQASQDDIKKFAEENAGMFGAGKEKIADEMNQEIMDFVMQTISGEGFDSYQLKNFKNIDDYLNNLDKGIQELIVYGNINDFKNGESKKEDEKWEEEYYSGIFNRNE